MSTIDYDDYPLLRYTSYEKDEVPTELPFELVSENTYKYVSKCVGFNEMFPLITIMNTLKKKKNNIHYYLNEVVFDKIDNSDQFRNHYFSLYNEISEKHGTICFKNAGQYVYILLDYEETRKIKKREGQYIAVALFQKNIFVGFEEGYISPDGISVEKTGFYDSGMNIGGYISFVLITLAYAQEKGKINISEIGESNIITLV